MKTRKTDPTYLSPEDDAFVRERLDAARKHHGDVVYNALQSGKNYTEAKDRVREKHGPGMWLAVLERDGLNPRTVELYMRAWASFGQKIESDSNLKIDLVPLFQLANKKVSEAARHEMLSRARGGEEIKRATGQEIKAKHTATDMKHALDTPEQSDESRLPPSSPPPTDKKADPPPVTVTAAGIERLEKCVSDLRLTVSTSHSKFKNDVLDIANRIEREIKRITKTKAGGSAADH